MTTTAARIAAVLTTAALLLGTSAATASAAPNAPVQVVSEPLCRLENVGTLAEPWLVLVSDTSVDGLCFEV